jgi:zinc transport system permease protein
MLRRMEPPIAMLDDFVIRALLGGIGVAVLAGPLGCFVVWRRMAFFGGALAHGALLGVGLGAVMALDPTITTMAVCLAFALLLALLERQQQLPTDTLLGILAHAALALGLIVLGFMETVRVDLMAYLFGDVLAVDRTDLSWIWGGGLLALVALAALWPWLLAITVSEELARAEGIRVAAVRLSFMMLIAVAVAIGMKIVGVLLIVSLLVIPPAAVRPFAATPEIMAVLAALAGALSVLLGLGASLGFDTPAGPSVVVAAATLFALGLTTARVARSRLFRHLARDGSGTDRSHISRGWN